MGKGLKIAAPPPRPAAPLEITPATDVPAAPAAPPTKRPPRGGKFDQVREGQMVQFNKRVPQAVADAFELLAIKTRRRVPELLAEAAELLQEKYGKV
jgi:hypothetical protein